MVVGDGIKRKRKFKGVARIDGRGVLLGKSKICDGSRTNKRLDRDTMRKLESTDTRGLRGVVQVRSERGDR